MTPLAGGTDAPNNAVSMSLLVTAEDARRWALYSLKNDSALYVSHELTRGAMGVWRALQDFHGRRL